MLLYLLFHLILIAVPGGWGSAGFVFIISRMGVMGLRESNLERWFNSLSNQNSTLFCRQTALKSLTVFLLQGFP